MLAQPKTRVLQLFEGLEGIWKLQRHLGAQGHMQGVAHFQPCGEGVLHYQEQGTATLGNGKALLARRAYAYVYDQGTIAVHFWDQKYKRPAGLLHPLQFHSCELSSQAVVATGMHKCAADVYKARYLFTNPQQFRLTYRVQGPHKNYTLTSHFSKVTDTRALEEKWKKPSFE